MSVDAPWYNEHFGHYRPRNVMKDVAFRQFYKRKFPKKIFIGAFEPDALKIIIC